MEELTWDFVEKYYPDYHRCDSIARNSDLQVIIDGETEIGTCAAKLLYDEFDGDEKNPKIQVEMNESLVDIYERSIQAFMEQQPKRR